jgi:hypothetical protein
MTAWNGSIKLLNLQQQTPKGPTFVDVKPHYFLKKMQSHEYLIPNQSKTGTPKKGHFHKLILIIKFQVIVALKGIVKVSGGKG